jgi:tRNA-Thr(GGU) m(6)t(6)A37 methyltransferase TsaA
MVRLTQIGTVKSGFTEPQDPFEMRKHESRIEVLPEYAAGLYRLDESAYIQVIFGFHLAGEYSLRGPVYSGETKGVFASRSPRRPSALGLSTVRLLKLEDTILHVRGLDAVDGTPVFDLKPFTPVFDYAEVEKINKERELTEPHNLMNRLVKQGDLVQCLMKAGELHGHFCPGLALGVYAAVRGMKEIEDWSLDGIRENTLVIVETNNCFADGLQVVTGCTFGNNALVFDDLGKTAATFAVRGGKSVRIAVKAEFWEMLHKELPDFGPLFEKVIKNRQGSEQDTRDFAVMSRKASFRVVEFPFDQVFALSHPKPNLPTRAPMFDTAKCDQCGEGVMQTRTMRANGKTLCLACGAKPFYRVHGAGISAVE